MPDYGLGGLFTGSLGLIGQKFNYEYSKKLAAQQNQYNIDMWKMQAAYNSPQAQMKRFEQAGLNPNLIYGQGSNGNMTTAPQLVTPNSPDFASSMSKAGEGLGKLFNIENIRTIRANRKKAEADAKNADINAERNRLQLFADKFFGSKYSYDYSTGRYVERPEDLPGEKTIVHPAAYYINSRLESNYNKSHLIPYRSALLEYQKRFYAPQVQMLNYEAKYKPWSFWIGNGSKALNSISSFF